MLVAVTNTECNEMVARSPGAIGPTTLLQVRAEPHPVRPLPWNGVEPTLENLASGRYPLGKSIHVVYRTPTSDGVRRFLAFLGSPRGQQLLRDLGALPLDFPAVD
jgi:phosphate transport system substrate-binding protein